VRAAQLTGQSHQQWHELEVAKKPSNSPTILIPAHDLKVSKNGNETEANRDTGCVHDRIATNKTSLCEPSVTGAQSLGQLAAATVLRKGRLPTILSGKLEKKAQVAAGDGRGSANIIGESHPITFQWGWRLWEMVRSLYAGSPSEWCRGTC
jgi:hypothetical protein